MDELVRNVILVGGAGIGLLILNALLNRVLLGPGAGRRAAVRRVRERQGGVPRQGGTSEADVTGSRGPRWPAPVALALAGALAGASCLSVCAREPEPGRFPTGRCGVEVGIFETAHARKEGTHATRRVVSELWRKDAGTWVLVREAMEPEWEVTDLPPGDYDVRVERSVEESGVERRLASTDNARFTLAAGERVEVAVVLEDPTRAVVAVAVPVAVLGIGFWAWNEVSEDNWLGGDSW
jgi:hypothetical protein